MFNGDKSLEKRQKINLKMGEDQRSPPPRPNIPVAIPRQSDCRSQRMNALGEIEIKVEGRVEARTLSPELVDIDEIREVLEQAGDLLFPGVRRAQRPLISYEIAEGSVQHRFRTLIQTVGSP